jgi:drug/metabolite transporter (DMT)-like permease
MMSYIWPIALVVVSNILYQIRAKSVPREMDAMASMTVTYLVGAVCSAVMFFVLNPGGSLLREYGKLNAAPVLLGISVVGLEVGFLYAYKAGWPVSTASIVQSAFLSLALLVVGALLYQEAVTPSKVLGVAICLVGLYFLSK